MIVNTENRSLYLMGKRKFKKYPKEADVYFKALEKAGCHKIREEPAVTQFLESLESIKAELIDPERSEEYREKYCSVLNEFLAFLEKSVAIMAPQQWITVCKEELVEAIPNLNVCVNTGSIRNYKRFLIHERESFEQKLMNPASREQVISQINFSIDFLSNLKSLLVDSSLTQHLDIYFYFNFTVSRLEKSVKNFLSTVFLLNHNLLDDDLLSIVVPLIMYLERVAEASEVKVWIEKVSPIADKLLQAEIAKQQGNTSSGFFKEPVADRSEALNLLYLWLVPDMLNSNTYSACRKN